jgi:hypothetical protein
MFDALFVYTCIFNLALSLSYSLPPSKINYFVLMLPPHQLVSIVTRGVTMVLDLAFDVPVPECFGRDSRGGGAGMSLGGPPSSRLHPSHTCPPTRAHTDKLFSDSEVGRSHNLALRETVFLLKELGDSQCVGRRVTGG